MILTIKTDQPKAEIGLHEQRKTIDIYAWQAHRALSDTLLKKIDMLLNENHTKLSDLKGIVVFKGPGSFTGLRIGMTVANTIAYSENIPITATSGNTWIEEGIEKIQQGKDEKISLPEYGGDANITKPRK